VWEVFARYITGEANSQGVKITQTPWCDEQLNSETSLITEHLAKGRSSLTLGFYYVSSSAVNPWG
jgi:hypothetical protein